MQKSGFSSMVDLKAELFRKQEEYKRIKSGDQTCIQGYKSADGKKPSIFSKKNKGLSDRARFDKVPYVEEENVFQKSREMLEKKAKLYEQMSNSEQIPDEDGSQVYLVDFQKKALDLNAEVRCSAVKPDDGHADHGHNTQESKGSRHPLDQSEKNTILSQTLVSQDMQREKQREKWEKEALEELNKPLGPVHYANVQHNEIRTHGVGFYQFSKDEQTRQQQLNMLNEMRTQTVEQREKRERLKAKRRAAMDARLQKVKLRRQIRDGSEDGITNSPPRDDPIKSELNETTATTTNLDSNGSINDNASADSSRLDSKDKKIHTREWDRGKLPEQFEDVEAQKKRLEDERNSEFAPPSFYYENKAGHELKKTLSKPNAQGKLSKGLMNNRHLPIQSLSVLPGEISRANDEECLSSLSDNIMSGDIRISEEITYERFDTNLPKGSSPPIVFNPSIPPPPPVIFDALVPPPPPPLTFDTLVPPPPPAKLHTLVPPPPHVTLDTLVPQPPPPTTLVTSVLPPSDTLAPPLPIIFDPSVPPPGHVSSNQNSTICSGCNNDRSNATTTVQLTSSTIPDCIPAESCPKILDVRLVQSKCPPLMAETTKGRDMFTSLYGVPEDYRDV